LLDVERLRASNVISESAHEQSSGHKEKENTAERADSIEEGFKFDEPPKLVKTNRKALILSSQQDHRPTYRDMMGSSEAIIEQHKQMTKHPMSPMTALSGGDISQSQDHRQD
jgi:hypothetical protein